MLAVCGQLAETDTVVREELGDVLGDDPLAASAFAGALLSERHPLVAAGAGLWVRAHFDSDRIKQWRSALPEQIASGDIPDQEKLDQWTSQRTMGPIKQFPLKVTPDAVCLLASALATKVSWEVPFEGVDAAELGPSLWARRLSRVLRTPADPRHVQFLTDTSAGLMAVHLARARGGLLVGSVIAADETVPSGTVLAEAERIVTAETASPGSVQRRSLFGLPIGPRDVWEISEEPNLPAGPFERDERLTSILLAWSASTEVNLADDTELGFGAAAASIARALELSDWRHEAAQSTVAKYSAVGFEPPAVTALAVAHSAQINRPETARRAVVRFRHPYAVVAAAFNDPLEPSPAVRHGLPVFSAWVADVVDAESSGTGQAMVLAM